MVDDSGGKFSSLRIDQLGNAHVVYVDESVGILKYGFWDHKLDKWFTTVLDHTAGYCAMTLDSQQHPHVSYIEYGESRIRYAHWTGTAWEKQTIQIRAKDISFYTSITLDGQNNPSISFYEYWGTGDNYLLHLRNVTWNGRAWEVRTVDSTPGSGKFNSIATDSSGRRQVAYANVKSENAGLRYATWNGNSWDVDILEGSGSEYQLFSVALAIDRNEVPHIAFSDAKQCVIQHAAKRDGKWRIDTVAKVAQVGYPDRNGIAIDERGTPYISYFDAGRGLLMLAHLNASENWATEIVDQNFAGFTSSLQIKDQTIYLTYAGENGTGLKFARATVEMPAMALREPSQSDSLKKR